MPQNRYFSPVSMKDGDHLFLRDEEHHYLRQVMRQRVGETIDLINGKGTLASGKIVSIEKNETEVALISVIEQTPPAFSLRLVLGFLKPSHFEYACEKATELGVTSFCFFPAKLSEKREISEQYLKRLQNITLSATKQCGRLFLPSIVVKERLQECLDDSLMLFGDLEASIPIKSLELSSSISLVIGPESGFSDQERMLLLQKGAKGVLLHQNTLRAETAAAMGIASLFEKLS